MTEVGPSVWSAPCLQVGGCEGRPSTTSTGRCTVRRTSWWVILGGYGTHTSAHTHTRTPLCLAAGDRRAERSSRLRSAATFCNPREKTDLAAAIRSLAPAQQFILIPPLAVRRGAQLPRELIPTLTIRSGREGRQLQLLLHLLQVSGAAAGCLPPQLHDGDVWCWPGGRDGRVPVLYVYNAVLFCNICVLNCFTTCWHTNFPFLFSFLWSVNV